MLVYNLVHTGSSGMLVYSLVNRWSSGMLVYILVHTGSSGMMGYSFVHRVFWDVSVQFGAQRVFRMQRKLGALAAYICFNKYYHIWYKYDDYY